VNEYTIGSALAVVAVVVAELVWLRTGVLRTATFWIAYGVVVFFQCLVDGWLTKLSAPIVIYNPDQFSGWRFPFDIPVEDFLFGFALVALTIILWERAGGVGRPGGAGAGGSARGGSRLTHPR
jgi:lycopene cyclase domain-containing protein